MSIRDVENTLSEARKKNSRSMMRDYVMGGGATAEPCSYEDMSYILQKLNEMSCPKEWKQDIVFAAINRGDVKEGTPESKFLYGCVRDNIDKFDEFWQPDDSRKVVGQNVGVAIDDIQSGKIKPDSKFYGETITALAANRDKDERLKSNGARDWLYNQALTLGRIDAVENLIEDAYAGEKPDEAFVDKVLRDCYAKFAADDCTGIYQTVAKKSKNSEVLRHVSACMTTLKSKNNIYHLADTLSQNPYIPENVQKNCVKFDLTLPDFLQGSLTSKVAEHTKNPEMLDLCLGNIDKIVDKNADMFRYMHNHSYMSNCWDIMNNVLKNPNKTEQNVASVSAIANSGKVKREIDASCEVLDKLIAMKKEKSTTAALQFSQGNTGR